MPCPFNPSQGWIKQYLLLSVSLGVCQGLGADFRRKSEIRKPALWGRKGKLELTESAREFQKVSAPQSRLARSEGEEATGPATRPTFSVAPAFSLPF
jgi:hypothetical protein